MPRMVDVSWVRVFIYKPLNLIETLFLHTLQHHCTRHAQAHTEGHLLQVAPNLQVAKALRQCCQLIVGQVPATSITPPPISVTCQHFPPRCNPCIPAHPFSITAPGMHKHTQRGSTYRWPPTFRSPKLSGSVASTFYLDAILAHLFSITAPGTHKHTQRGSTYRWPPTFRLPKLSGSVAS